MVLLAVRPVVKVSKYLLLPSATTTMFRILQARRKLGQGVEVRIGMEVDIQEVRRGSSLDACHHP